MKHRPVRRPPLASGTGRRPLTPAGKPIAHLRSILVATGALPVRDEHLARLERWIARLIADRPDHDERQLLRRYGLWHLVRRLRGRLRDQHATHEQVTVVQQHTSAPRSRCWTGSPATA